MMRRPSKWPFWVIITSGVLIIAAIIVWAGTVYDSHGETLITPAVATVIVAFLTAVTAVAREYFAKLGQDVKRTHDDTSTVLTNQDHVITALNHVRGDLQRHEDRSEKRFDSIEHHLTDHETKSEARFADLEQKENPDA